MTSKNVEKHFLVDLNIWHATVDGRTLGRDIETMFAQRPTLPAVIVTEEAGKLIGLLSRQRFNALMARPLSVDLCHCRPISRLFDDDPWEDWVLPADTPIEIAAMHAWSRDEAQLYEPLAIGLPDFSFGIVHLFDLFQALAERLEQQNAKSNQLLGELSATNSDLQATLAHLRETQANLVQSEKMASLGGLVAGVAHEVNTPIGILLGASSHCAGVVRSLRTRYADSSLTATMLERDLAKIEDAMHLIERNAKRAVELLDGFKKIAVDQTSSQRRTFLLGPYIEDVLSTLGPRFRNSPLTIRVDCPDAIECDSLPGALAQILINLVLNAAIHAFEPEQPGEISLTARERDGTVSLIVADNGKGIDPAHLPHIFDPFFTTKRAEGGSGLGLHIVYNLMVSALAGSVDVKSSPGAGTKFTLSFPRIHSDFLIKDPINDLATR